MKQEDLASEYGVSTRHERMPNGELRFRLIGPDGSAYVRTVAGEGGAWQNSHFHLEVRETYVVERGWMGYVVLAPRTGTPKWRVLRKGAIVTTPVRLPHNVYLPAGAVIHTVKHSGQVDVPDWHAATELDSMTKHIDEAELLRLAAGAK